MFPKNWWKDTRSVFFLKEHFYSGLLYLIEKYSLQIVWGLAVRVYTCKYVYKCVVCFVFDAFVLLNDTFTCLELNVISTTHM